MVIDCKRNAGSKKNLSLARFWLNSEIGIHQMFSNALSESANTFTCSRIIHSQSRENCSRMIFCIMEGFFNQDHLEYWCICRQTETLGRLNKLDKLQICIYDFVCVLSKQHIGLIAGLITQFMIITHWSKGLAVKVVDIFWVPKLLTSNFHGRILCYTHRFILKLFLCE